MAFFFIKFTERLYLHRPLSSISSTNIQHSLYFHLLMFISLSFTSYNLIVATSVYLPYNADSANTTSRHIENFAIYIREAFITLPDWRSTSFQ